MHKYFYDNIKDNLFKEIIEYDKTKMVKLNINILLFYLYSMILTTF